eukprot:scaffold12086_cov160-Amphora_coffeaeformis.AAC.5
MLRLFTNHYLRPQTDPEMLTSTFTRHTTKSFYYLSLIASTTTRTMASLPSTLTGPPVASLVPPKVCQFGPDFTDVPLLETFKVSDSTSVFRFGVPDTSKPLNLSTCACILAQAEIGGEGVVRPYTPISTNANVGYFDLLVKNYGETAKMSRHMHEMKVGDKLNFKHIDFSEY